MPVPGGHLRRGHEPSLAVDAARTVEAFANWRRLLRPGGRVVAIDGFWFAEEEDDGEDADSGPFAAHYTAETRAALPLMAATELGQVVALFRDAGFGAVEAGKLEGLSVSGMTPYAIVASG